MRIGINLCFIKDDINVGVGLYAKQLIEGFLLNNSSNTYIIFVSRQIRNQIKEIINNSHIEIVLVENSFIKQYHINKIIRECFILKREIHKANLDVYINPHTNIFSVINNKSKNVCVLHDLHFKYYPKYYNFFIRNILKWKTKCLLKNADKITTSSNFVKKDILEIYNFLQEKDVCIVGNPVEIPNIILKENKNRKKYILSVNSFAVWKNQITLLKAFEHIKDKISHNLILIGYGNAINCVNFIKEKKLDDRVEIKQHVSEEELYSYYKGASLFVNTSLFEGFGRSNIEAGLMKVPVLSSVEMCLKEVSFGLLNYYEPATDDLELARKILCCLKENSYSVDYLEMVKRKFEYEYNKKKIGYEFLKIIDTLN